MTQPEMEAMRREAPLLVAALFDGSTYEPLHDQERLNSQLWRVYRLMRDGKARTVAEIQAVVAGSESALTARCRDFRKPRFKELFGVRGMESKRLKGGTWAYRMETDQKGLTD